MTDLYKNFQELQNNYREEIDYRVQTDTRSNGLIIIAIHAGGIEMGTSELARAIAGNVFSMYLFEGLAPNSQNLHVTSTNFDEPRCLQLVHKHQTSLSLHGFTFTEKDPQVYLGGKNLPLIEHLLATLIKGGYPTRINTGKFSATDPANICNRAISGTGVQVELSSQLRSQFFEDYLHRKGRINKTPQFEHFVQIVQNTLRTYSGLAL